MKALWTMTVPLMEKLSDIKLVLVYCSLTSPQATGPSVVVAR